jgi:hypothetical protein
MLTFEIQPLARNTPWYTSPSHHFAERWLLFDVLKARKERVRTFQLPRQGLPHRCQVQEMLAGFALRHLRDLATICGVLEALCRVTRHVTSRFG